MGHRKPNVNWKSKRGFPKLKQVFMKQEYFFRNKRKTTELLRNQSYYMALNSSLIKKILEVTEIWCYRKILRMRLPLVRCLFSDTPSLMGLLMPTINFPGSLVTSCTKMYCR